MIQHLFQVHAFYSGPSPASAGSRRLSQPTRTYYAGRRAMPRSGSDQHLPRVEYGLGTPHTLLRSSLKSGSYATGRYRTGEQPFSAGTLARRHRPSLDYASDTEATCTSSPRSSYYYRYVTNNNSHLLRINVQKIYNILQCSKKA